MDFDQMMAAWKQQDEQPLYGVDRDLLRLIVQSEQSDLQRTLRREKWMTYAAGAVMTAGACAVLWLALHRREPMFAALAAVSAGTFTAWAVAMWRSHRRQARRERGFGNSLHAEVRRTLSAIDYQLSITGRWAALTLWSAPVIVGASLLYWLIAEINDNTPTVFDLSMIVFIILSTLWTNVTTSNNRKRTLLPRRRQLQDLLSIFDKAS